ncbi:MAG: DUF2127 domain-containing protein [Acidobacteria bacterium]|nr:DUF2127 domain-containing protein [Acidobacteriota bacterium]
MIVAMGSDVSKRLPPGREHRTRLQALRTVALLEFAKGLLVLVAAFSLMFLVDPSDLAAGFLDFLHISPDRHFAQLLLNLADSLSNAKEWVILVTACSYSGLRFAEAYGLWKARAWAEWIALISGALYLPFEIRLLAHRLTLFHAAVLIVNLAIVAFMFYLRIYVPRHERLSFPSPRIG